MDIKTFRKTIIDTFERTKGREKYEYGISTVDGKKYKARRYRVANKIFYEIKIKYYWINLIDVLEVIK